MTQNVKINPQQRQKLTSIPLADITSKQQQIFLRCYFCQQSQQQTMSDIFNDMKCHIFNSCYRCYKKNKNQSMQCSCKLKLKDHLKLKNAKKQHILDQGLKKYEKQFKIRSTWEQLDQQFVNILTYNRQSKLSLYPNKQRQLKNILKQIKNKQKLIFGDLKKMKVPQFMKRQNNDPTGKDACGYQNSYNKGLKFLYDAFQI